MIFYFIFLVSLLILFVLFVLPFFISINITPFTIDVRLYGIKVYKLIGKKLYKKILGMFEIKIDPKEESELIKEMVKLIYVNKVKILFLSKYPKEIHYKKYYFILKVLEEKISNAEFKHLHKFEVICKDYEEEDLKISMSLWFNIGSILINYLIIRRKYGKKDISKRAIK